MIYNLLIIDNSIIEDISEYFLPKFIFIFRSNILRVIVFAF